MSKWFEPAIRAAAMLMLREGKSSWETSHATGLKRNTIDHWKQEYIRGEIDILFDGSTVRLKKSKDRHRKKGTPIPGVFDPPMPLTGAVEHHRTLTGFLMGDPLPGRSALDRRP